MRVTDRTYLPACAAATASAPVCYLHVDAHVQARVTRAHRVAVRAFDREPGAEVIETTRLLAGRRWRRLDPGRP